MIHKIRPGLTYFEPSTHQYLVRHFICTKNEQSVAPIKTDVSYRDKYLVIVWRGNRLASEWASARSGPGVASAYNASAIISEVLRRNLPPHWPHWVCRGPLAVVVDAGGVDAGGAEVGGTEVTGTLLDVGGVLVPLPTLVVMGPLST